jgi:hypothetical protein
MRSRSSKTSGLRPWSSSDEGARGGVAHGHFAVDDLEHRQQRLGLRGGEVAVLGVGQAELANHLPGGFPGAQQLERRGDDLPREADQLLLVGGDPLFQIRAVPGVLGPLLAQGTAAAHRLDRRRDHQHGGDATAPADGEPRRRRHQGDSGSGHRGHRYGRQQQHARGGKFSATGRGLNTHHVGLLKEVGWGSAGLARGYVMKL